MFRNLFIVVFFLLSTANCGFAQFGSFISEKSLANSQKYSVQVWNTENGLPQNSINDIAQTNDGYIWLATFDGLVRFDGIKFTIYNSSNTPSIVYNGVKKLFVDAQGCLWIVSAEGDLMSYQNNTFKNYYLPEKVKFYANSISDWNQNSIVVLCDNNKIYVVNAKATSEFTLPPAINNINSIITKYTDQLYIASEMGLYSYVNKQWFLFDETKNKSINKLVKSHNSDIFMDMNKELFIVKNQVLEKITLPIKLSAVKNYSIGFNEQKKICVYTADGIYIIENNKTSSYISTQSGLSSSNISSVFVDKQNNFWIGTSNDGLNKLKHKVFKTLSKEDGLETDGVNGILETKAKRILVANNCAGLSEYALHKFKKFMGDKYNHCVWSLLEDEHENIWFGTFGAGVFVVHKNGNIKNYTDKDGLPSNVVFSLFQDSRKKIWLGTDKGLGMYDGNKFEIVDTKFKESISTINEDKSKQLLLSTSKGLGLLSGSKIVLAESLKNVNVRYTYEDADGVLWIGTHGQGLIRLKNGKRFNFTSELIAMDNNVWSISEDDAGNFWLPSNSGMYVLNRKELNDLADLKINNVSSKFFSKEDGLKSNEFNGGFMPTVLKASTGEFWFPTIKGIAIADLNRIKKSDFTPQICIESIKVDDVESKINDTLFLKSDNSSLAILFSAPSFINPQKNYFQYKLDGVNNDWINILAKHEIKLNDLPSGTYSIRIRIAGDPNNKEKSIVVVKDIPFWKNSKLLLVVFISLILISVVVVFSVINFIKKKERIRTQLNKQYANIELKALQAQMNPHFIFNCLNSIQHFILVNDELLANKYLSKFSKLMRMFLEHSKSQTVSLQEEIDLLCLYIELESLRFKNGFNFKLKVNDDVNTYDIQLPSMLFQPFVENAINHGLLNLTTKGTLTLGFSIENNYLIGVVDDDGIGREKAKELRSNTNKSHVSRGMEIVTDRIAVLNTIENLKIDLTIKDKKDTNGNASGTQVVIKIPI